MNIIVSKLKSKKPPKVRTTFQKQKYFEKLAHYVPNNAMPSHMAKIHRNIKNICIICIQLPMIDFTDVTLVSEDGQHQAAHSVILAATSPRVRTSMLTKKIHNYPLI